jgi:signal transduction histidine kinase
MKNADDSRPSEVVDVPEVPSAERVSTGARVPSEWLDRLLAAHCGLRANAGLEESATQLLSVVRELLDDVAVGVCIPYAGALADPGASASARALTSPSPAMDGPPPRAAGARTKQIVIRLLPARTSQTIDADPARLFPELAHERVTSIAGDEGATLHLAADDEARLADGAPATQVVERLGMMLAALLDNHRAQDRSLRDLKSQVIQSEKLASLGQIAAGIVHELNNPLTTIVAYSDFLRKKTERRGGDPADVERLSRINEAAERILRFSRDLTAYSRPSSEVPAPVAIHDIIERALVFCEHELDKTGVMVERNFGEVRAVRGVAGQLTQVFVNLFTNAAHAMVHEGGLLSISTSMTDDEVQVTITDDGHGIDVEHRARVFDPFFTTKTDGTGTGLGLSIVRSIVQSHGGRISVGGAEPRGTVFQVELPRAAAPKSEP